ncbi:MAG: MFS transporter [Ktedonobacteraceae bacterium]
MRNEGNESMIPPVEAEQGEAQTRERYGDARLILLMRGLRSLVYGLLAVILGVVLAGEGFSPAAIGVLITVSLLGDMAGTYVIGLFADTWGLRHTLAVLSLVMATTGVIFGLVTSYPVLLLAAFFGTLGTSASETAPFLPIDQAMLAQVTVPEHRTALFARYNLVASLSAALGALAAGLPGLLTQVGLPPASGIRLLFGMYAALALGVAGLSLQLSSPVEAPGHPPIEAKHLGQRLAPPLHRSRGIVWRLTTLFSVDAASGGLVAQSLMALFFHLRFGVSLTTLSALFFGANLLSALSFLAAVPLARRFGLLNTMVFTHLPSNVLLALVAFAPPFPLRQHCCSCARCSRRWTSRPGRPTRWPWWTQKSARQRPASPRLRAAWVPLPARFSRGCSCRVLCSCSGCRSSWQGCSKPVTTSPSGSSSGVSMYRKKRIAPDRHLTMHRSPRFHHRKRQEQRLGMAGGGTNERDPSNVRRSYLADPDRDAGAGAPNGDRCGANARRSRLG